MVTINGLDDSNMHTLFSYLMRVNQNTDKNAEHVDQLIIECQSLIDTLGLRDIVSGANEVYQDLKDRIPSSQEREAFIHIAERVATVTDSFMYLGSFFKDLDGNVHDSDLRMFVYCLVIGIKLNYVRMHPTKFQALDLVIAVFAWKYVLGVKFNSLPDFFNRHLFNLDILSFFRRSPPAEEPEAQMIDVTLDEFIDSIAASIAGISIFKSITGKNKSSFLKDLSDIMRLKNGMSSFLTNLVSIFDKIQAYLFETKMGGYAAKMNSSGSHVIEIFIEDFEEVKLLVSQKKMAVNLENLARLTALIKQGERIYGGITRTPGNANMCSILQVNLNYLRKIITVFTDANLSLAGFRQESVTVVITGPPGIMKSHYAKHLGYGCVNIHKPKLTHAQIISDPNAHMHTRQSENSFWDGYVGTESVVFFDDFGQMRDVAGNPDNEFMNFIRAMNSFEMHLHMSSIDAKGNCYFRSPFIVATTNIRDFKPKSIISTEALERRFDFFIEMELKPKFRKKAKNGTYTYNEKVPRDEHGELEISPDLYLFSKLEKNDKGDYEVSNLYTHGELMAAIRKLYNIKKQRFETHERLFSQILAKYGEFEVPVDTDESSEIVMTPVFDDFERPSAEMARSEESDQDSTSESTPKDHFLNDYDQDEFDDSEEDECECCPGSHDCKYDTSNFHYNWDSPPIRPSVPLLDVSSNSSDYESSDYDGDSAYESATEEHIEAQMENVPLSFPPRLNYFEQYVQVSPFRGPMSALLNYNAGIDVKIRRTCDDLILRTLGGMPFNIAIRHGNIGAARVYDLLEYHPESERIISSFPSMYILTIILCSFPDLVALTFIPEGMALERIKLEISEIIFPVSPLVDAVFLDGVELNGLRRDIGDMTSKIKNACKDFIIVYGKSIALCAFGLGTLTYLKEPLCKLLGFSPDDPIDINIFGYESKAKSQTKKVVKLSSKTLGSKNSKPESQVGMNALAELQISFKKKNVFSIEVEDPLKDQYCSIGYAVFIRDNVCLVPAHYVFAWKTEIDEDSAYGQRKLKFYDSESKFRTSALINECIEHIFLDDDMGAHDYLCMRVPGFNAVRDISRYILTEKEACDLHDSFPISFYDKDRNLFKEATAFVQKTTIEVSISPEISYEVIRCIKYKVESSKGWCGLPILACINNQPKFVGFHIAGIRRTETAYASIVNAEAIQSCLVDQDFTVDLAQEQPLAEAQSGPSHLIDRFALLGKAPSGNHRTVGSSSIRPSPLQDVGFIPLTRPALLYPMNGIDPYEVALSHYGKHFQKSNYGCVSLAVEDLSNFLTFNSSDRPRVIFDLEKALWGDAADENFNAIKSSSSPGYPMKSVGDDLKKALFSEGSIRDSSNPRYSEIEMRVEEVVNNATLGIRMLWIFTDCLKDERRPIEKVLSGSTRLYNGCPMIYFVAFRMYFGAFAANCIDKKIENNMVLGVDPHSHEWDTIAQSLKKFECMGDGDFSKFDASELSYFHWKLLDIINDWYDDGLVNRRIRKILWMEVVNSRHIIDDLVYEWTGSLPSGHPLTTIINCLYNMFAFRYCYYRLVPAVHHHSFDTHVVLFVLGDDNVFSFSHLIKHWFNEQTLGEAMIELGLTFTPASKSTNDFMYRTLEELSFLKRMFVYEPLVSRYIGPLDRKSIDDIPLWTKKGSQRTQIFIDNVSEYLGELSLHPEKDYIEGRNAMIAGIRKAGFIDHFPNLMIGRKPSLLKRLTDV